MTRDDENTDWDRNYNYMKGTEHDKQKLAASHLVIIVNSDLRRFKLHIIPVAGRTHG